MRPRTVRLNEEEYALIAQLQRMVKWKGTDKLRQVLSPAAIAMLDGEPKLTKRLAVGLAVQNLLDRLENHFRER